MSSPRQTGIPTALNRITQLLAKFPGVGEKTALRLAIFLVENPEVSSALGPEMAELHNRVGACSSCNGLTVVGEPCAICTDAKRDPHLICVVHRVQDMLAIEQCGAMRGNYFVLGKILSPLEGVGREAVPAGNLVRRIHDMTNFLRAASDDRPVEVLIASPPTVDGEATSLFLQMFIRDTLTDDPPRMSTFASGVSYGSDLSYANQMTLMKAFSGRRDISP